MPEASSESSRPSASLIYERVLEDAHDELERPSSSLAISGLFAGFTLGATPLAFALALTFLPGAKTDDFIAAFVFPIGFVAVILGRAQLFTENTLYPVAASFSDRRCIGPTARLWAVVLAGNVVGGLLFALLVVDTAALSSDLIHEITAIGNEVSEGGFAQNFWSGVLAGWVLATVAWLVEAATTAIGQIAAIWALVVLIALGKLEHCVASSIEVAAAMFQGAVGFGEWVGWLGTVTLANALGGVLIVALLNYGQVRAPQGEGGAV